MSWLADVSEVHTKRVVGMMRAFGSGGRSGPTIVLSWERCPAIACDHEASRAMTGQWWWSNLSHESPSIAIVQAVGKEGLTQTDVEFRPTQKESHVYISI